MNDYYPRGGELPVSEPLPDGFFHLLLADDDLAQLAAESRLMTLCGELVSVSSLPPSCYPRGCEIERDPRYCLKCVREAARWNTETAPAPGAT